MLTILFLIFLFGIFGKLFLFGIRAAWGISKFILMLVNVWYGSLKSK